jgi:hypothetical protein
MRRPEPGEAPDVLLDGRHEWVFDSLAEALSAYSVYNGRQGVRWPDWDATKARLEEEHATLLEFAAHLKIKHRLKVRRPRRRGKRPVDWDRDG